MRLSSEESRTSLLSTSAALQEIGEAIDFFVVFLQEKPHLAICREGKEVS